MSTVAVVYKHIDWNDFDRFYQEQTSSNGNSTPTSVEEAQDRLHGLVRLMTLEQPNAGYMTQWSAETSASQLVLNHKISYEELRKKTPFGKQFEKIREQQRDLKKLSDKAVETASRKTQDRHLENYRGVVSKVQDLGRFLDECENKLLNMNCRMDLFDTETFGFHRSENGPLEYTQQDVLNDWAKNVKAVEKSIEAAKAELSDQSNFWTKFFSVVGMILVALAIFLALLLI